MLESDYKEPQAVFIPIEIIAFAQNQREEVRDLKGISGALAAENGIHQQTFVCQTAQTGSNGLGITTDIAYTLDSNSTQAICIPSNDDIYLCMATQQGGAEIGNNLCPTITASADMSGNNQPVLCFKEKKSYCLQGNMIGREDKNEPQGNGINEDISFTLSTTYKHAVAYDCRNDKLQEVSTTLQAKSGGGYSLNYINPVLVENNNDLKCFGSNGISKYKESVETLRASGGDCGGGSENLIVQHEINSKVAGTLDASYYKGCGERNGIEREIVLQNNKKLINVYSQQRSDEYKESEQASTLAARDYKSATDLIIEPHYVVRRLTPIECLRLQGLPDWWCDDIAIENPTKEDIEFWTEVLETQRKIVGTSKKSITEKQVRKFLKNPYSDSACYKMIGNGISIPTALYVMQGTRNILEKC